MEPLQLNTDSDASTAPTNPTSPSKPDQNSWFLQNLEKEAQIDRDMTSYEQGYPPHD
jgi:hypothetical protein